MSCRFIYTNAHYFFNFEHLDSALLQKETSVRPIFFFIPLRWAILQGVVCLKVGYDVNNECRCKCSTEVQCVRKGK